MKIFVYGTLMRENYNHERFGFNIKARFLMATALKGYRLYDLGAFPCIVHTGSPEDAVLGEVYDVQDKELLRMMKTMEEGAGYTERTVEVGGVAAIAYVFEDLPPNARPIESGNWNDVSRR